MPDASDTRAEAPRSLLRSVHFDIVRAEPGDGLTLAGHAAVFNTWTDINSWEGVFQERFAPGSFKKTIRENGTRVKLQFDHGTHPLIGSMPLGSVRKLREDAQGLYVEARLSDNWLIQPVRDAIADGAIDGMSIRLIVERESWDGLDGSRKGEVPRRTVEEARLLELGPVVFPAYATTDVGVRSRRIAEDLFRADDSTRREVARLLTFGLPDEDDPPESTREAPEPLSEAVEDTSERAATDDAPPDQAPVASLTRLEAWAERMTTVRTALNDDRDPELHVRVARYEHRMRKEPQSA